MKFTSTLTLFLFYILFLQNREIITRREKFYYFLYLNLATGVSW